MQTLKEFLDSPARNAFIKHRKFKDFYVRKGQRFFGRSRGDFFFTIDIARITARKPGHGAFKELIREIRSYQPDAYIYVECVLDERFAQGLLRMGFTQHTFNEAPSFYLEPTVPSLVSLCQNFSLLMGETGC